SIVRTAHNRWRRCPSRRDRPVSVPLSRSSWTMIAPRPPAKAARRWPPTLGGAAPRPTALHECLSDPRRAITHDGVMCLVCGGSFRRLTNTHLRAHGLTSEEYKQRFGYNVRRALMIPWVRRRHSDNASRSGLAGRIRRRPIVEDIELRRLGGRHPHALE